MSDDTALRALFEREIEPLLRTHAKLQQAGTGEPVQHWIVALQQKVGSIRHA